MVEPGGALVAELTTKAVRRTSFSRVDDLQRAIAQFLEARNEQPKALVWTAMVESILAKHTRCRHTLEQVEILSENFTVLSAEPLGFSVTYCLSAAFLV